MAPDHTEGRPIPTIRGVLESLSVYDITDYELESIENGLSDSILLNMAIFSFSTAISFFIVILTTNIDSDSKFIAFIIITTAGFTASIVLFVIWLRSSSRTKSMCTKIRSRLKAKAEAD
jgi:hypothetical protein